jgi:LuxR family maltose regulon positive regulatory protein
MLAATRAIIAIMEGDAAGAIELSQRALEYLPKENWVWRSVVIRNLGNAYLLTGRTTAASQAFQEAFLSSQAAGNSYMTIVTLYELAELQIVQGQLQKAYRTCSQALELASGQEAPGFTITGAVHVGLSEILRQWNELEDGMRHALSGIELGRQGRSLGIQVCGYTRLALLARARGDEAMAARYFQRAAQLAPHRRRTSFIAHHDIQASLWGRQGDPDSSIYWAQQIGLVDGSQLTGEINYMNETAHIVLVRALLGLNRAEDALRLANRLRRDAEKAERAGRLIEILALQALALDALGRTAQALGVLKQALDLAGPQGYVRMFVDEGEDMGTLIRQLKSQVEKKPRSSLDEKQLRLLNYATKLLAAFRSGPSRPPFPLLNEKTAHFPVKSTPTPKPISNLQSLSSGYTQPLNLQSPITNPLEPLSQRENEILSLIAAGLSNQQIANRLVLAPSTINWHMKNIYSKLDVHSRTQAVARAVELGIFV